MGTTKSHVHELNNQTKSDSMLLLNLYSVKSQLRSGAMRIQFALSKFKIIHCHPDSYRGRSVAFSGTLMKSLIAATCTLLVLLAAACTCNKEPEKKEEVNIHQRDSLLTEEKLLDRQWGDCENSEFDCITITIVYPEIENKDSFAQSLNGFILNQIFGDKNTGFDSVEHLMTWYMEEYKKIKGEQKEYTAGWQIEKVVNIINNSNGIFSLRLDDSEFTGGAHPNTQTFFYNFDLNKEKILELNEILEPGYADSLNRLAEFYFYQSKELGDTDRSSADINFADKTFELHRNFVVDSAGLTFVFNKLEITPGSSGLSEFTIPYTELQKTGLIKKDGPLAYLLGKES